MGRSPEKSYVMHEENIIVFLFMKVFLAKMDHQRGVSC